MGTVTIRSLTLALAGLAVALAVALARGVTEATALSVTAASVGVEVSETGVTVDAAGVTVDAAGVTVDVREARPPSGTLASPPAEPPRVAGPPVASPLPEQAAAGFAPVAADQETRPPSAPEPPPQPAMPSQDASMGGRAMTPRPSGQPRRGRSRSPRPARGPDTRPRRSPPTTPLSPAIAARRSENRRRPSPPRHRARRPSRRLRRRARLAVGPASTSPPPR